jgi:hypothetical protein
MTKISIEVRNNVRRGERMQSHRGMGTECRKIGIAGLHLLEDGKLDELRISHSMFW